MRNVALVLVGLSIVFYGCNHHDQASSATGNHPANAEAPAALFDMLPTHPLVTLSGVMDLLKTTKPTAIKAIDTLKQAGVLRETTGKQRNRVYAYHGYLQVLTKHTE